MYIRNIYFDLAKCRKECSMTQKQLARKSGISTAMISFIENGRRQPTLMVLAILARALKVTLNDLIVIKDGYKYFK